MEHTIILTTYLDGIEASCKYKNRRVCIFYDYENKNYTIAIKALLKEDGSFCAIAKNKGINRLSMRLSEETFSIIFECKMGIVDYLLKNDK